MTAKTLVYVHGAGPQKPATALKQELDTLLFGGVLASSRVAHYSDVRWPPAGAIAGRQPAGPPSARRAARERVVKSTENPVVSPRAAARAIVATSMGAVPTGTIAARGGRAIPGQPGAPAAPAGPDGARATQLVEQLYRRADSIARRSSADSRRLTAGISFPDPIFRRIVGFFASDVVDYLYGPFRDAMRAPVRHALLTGAPPDVIIAHSLGTIILYDVLSEPAFAGFDVQLLVTVGSPLGIGNVQSRLRDGAGRPNPVPGSVQAWSNFADRWDPVALDPTLRNEFSPPKDLARDEAVNNPAKNNHDLTGYLSVAIVRSSITTAVGS